MSNNMKSTAMKPIFQVAHEIIDQIHDYPTLILLSMTCRTFHGAVHNSQAHLTKAFNNLETLRTDGGPPEESVPVFEFCSRTCTLRHKHTTYRFEDFDDQALRVNNDIFRFDCGQLRRGTWIPCYGCNTIKPQWRTFFLDQLEGAFGLLCKSARARRCIDCAIHDDHQVSQRYRTDHARAHPKHPPHLSYLLDMPRQIPGFRLRCSLCRAVEWAPTKPRKSQVRKRLCAACFDASLAEGKQDRNLLFKEEWLRLLEVEARAASAKVKVKDTAKGKKGRIDVDDMGGVEPLSFESLYHFEVLRGLDMV